MCRGHGDVLRRACHRAPQHSAHPRPPVVATSCALRATSDRLPCTTVAGFSAVSRSSGGGGGLDAASQNCAACPQQLAHRSAVLRHVRGPSTCSVTSTRSPRTCRRKRTTAARNRRQSGARTRAVSRFVAMALLLARPQLADAAASDRSARRRQRESPGRLLLRSAAARSCSTWQARCVAVCIAPARFRLPTSPAAHELAHGRGVARLQATAPTRAIDCGYEECAQRIRRTAQCGHPHRARRGSVSLCSARPLQ